MAETVDTVKSAHISIELKADSGYEASVYGRVSPEQWGRICAIVDEGSSPIKPLSKD